LEPKKRGWREHNEWLRGFSAEKRQGLQARFDSKKRENAAGFHEGGVIARLAPGGGAGGAYFCQRQKITGLNEAKKEQNVAFKDDA